LENKARWWGKAFSSRKKGKKKKGNHHPKRRREKKMLPKEFETKEKCSTLLRGGGKKKEKGKGFEEGEPRRKGHSPAQELGKGGGGSFVHSILGRRKEGEGPKPSVERSENRWGGNHPRLRKKKGKRKKTSRGGRANCEEKAGKQSSVHLPRIFQKKNTTNTRKNWKGSGKLTYGEGKKKQCQRRRGRLSV